jgi:AcrR family transcriptional regulator
MAEHGFPRFSAREVAKRIGYSVGTLYNVFGTYDRLVLAINTETFRLWTRHLQDRLAEGDQDRIRALVEGYFSFARANRNLWMAIYDHRLPSGMPIPEEFLPDRSKLTNMHGHCTFALDGTFELMGVKEPEELALARVRDSLAAA